MVNDGTEERIPDMQESYEGLLARYEDIVSLARSKPVTGIADLHIREEVPTGIYEHFKSKTDDAKFYAVYGVGRDVDSGSYRVSYQALYGEHKGLMAFRQLVGRNPKTRVHDGFLLPVDRGSYRGPRFRLVEKAADLHHLCRLAEKYLSARAA